MRSKDGQAFRSCRACIFGLFCCRWMKCSGSKVGKDSVSIFLHSLLQNRNLFLFHLVAAQHQGLFKKQDCILFEDSNSPLQVIISQGFHHLSNPTTSGTFGFVVCSQIGLNALFCLEQWCLHNNLHFNSGRRVYTVEEYDSS